MHFRTVTNKNSVISRICAIFLPSCYRYRYLFSLYIFYLFIFYYFNRKER
nr:MAG TPA: hypothetical protein [Caudoviricetes sp.]